MTKKEAISIFRNVTQLSVAMGISRQAIYMWPEVIPMSVQDRVLGAAVRNGVNIPIKIISEIKEANAA